MEHIDFVRFTNETVHLRSQYLNTIPVVPIVAAKEASNKIHHRHNSWQQEQEAIRQKVSLHY